MSVRFNSNQISPELLYKAQEALSNHKIERHEAETLKTLAEQMGTDEARAFVGNLDDENFVKAVLDAKFEANQVEFHVDLDPQDTVLETVLDEQDLKDMTNWVNDKLTNSNATSDALINEFFDLKEQHQTLSRLKDASQAPIELPKMGRGILLREFENLKAQILNEIQEVFRKLEEQQAKLG